MPEIVDTFPAFLALWEVARAWPLDAQIVGWAERYLAPWPELLEKQQEAYRADGLDWREAARAHVFPYLEERLPAMAAARGYVLAGAVGVYERARIALGLDFDVVFCIYVGIGCGAGWATTLGGVPACLYGLENVAECGWSQPDTLAAMTAHELGHLAHQRWRAAAGRPVEEAHALWQLYEEGLAQRCEHAIMGADTWSEQSGQGDWVSWCAARTPGLAASFLAAVDAGRPVQDFFGSWYNIEGRTQSGYYLGHEIIRDWERASDLRAIAVLPWDEIQPRVRESLARLAAGG